MLNASVVLVDSIISQQLAFKIPLKPPPLFFEFALQSAGEAHEQFSHAWTARVPWTMKRTRL